MRRRSVESTPEYSESPSPLESLDRVLKRNRPPPIDVSRSTERSQNEGEVKPTLKLNKWVYVGAALVLISLLVLLPLIIRRQRNSKKPPAIADDQKQSQFDRLLAAALAQEKEFKALQVQHGLLLQQLQADELKRAQEAQRAAEMRQRRVQIGRSVPSTIVEDDLESDDDLDMMFRKENVEPLIFTSSLISMPMMPARPTSSTVVEEVDEEEDQLDRELDRELEESERGRIQPQTQTGNEREDEGSAESKVEVAVEVEADPEVDHETTVLVPPLAPSLPAHIQPSAAVPLLVFDGDINVKPQPKAATKRTVKPRKPRVS